MFRHLISGDRRCVLFAIVMFLCFSPLSFAAAQSAKRSGVQANPAGETQVRTAYVRSLADAKVKFDDFKTIFRWLTKTSGKEKWREVRWRHDLWDARIESAKSGKPIFIWAMNGDPLGCV